MCEALEHICPKMRLDGIAYLVMGHRNSLKISINVESEPNYGIMKTALCKV